MSKPGLLNLPTIDQLKRMLKVADPDSGCVHPYVKYCASQYFNGRPLHINFQGVAQHYGFHTDMLDVTSNFEVATFFACCEWNGDAKCYLPVVARESPGIIYSVEPSLYSLGSVQFAVKAGKAEGQTEF